VDARKALRIATRYASIGELVEKMHRFCDGTTLFVATRDARAVGTEAPFALQLADATQALRGWCVVLDAWTTPDNPFRRPGVWLGLRRLTPRSQAVLEKLRARRAAQAPAAGAEVERRRRRSTVRTPKVQVTLPAGATLAAAGSLAAAPARVVLPANPLVGVDDDALDSVIDGMRFDEAAALVADAARRRRRPTPAPVRRAHPPSWAPPPVVVAAPRTDSFSQPAAAAPAAAAPAAAALPARRAHAADAIRWSLVLATAISLLGVAAALRLAI
jgi:hypothetical protein